MEGIDRESVPAWMPGLAESIKADRASLPSALLADAMRERGEYPADPRLWTQRLCQLDALLFIATTTQQSTTDRVNSLSDPELAYIARWVALVNPEIAERGLEALATFKRDHSNAARLLFGAETNGDQ